MPALDILCACGHKRASHEHYAFASQDRDLVEAIGRCKKCKCVKFRFPFPTDFELQSYRRAEKSRHEKSRHIRRITAPHGLCAQYCIEHERDADIDPCKPCGEESVRADAVEVGDVIKGIGKVDFGFGEVTHAHRILDSQNSIEIHREIPGYGVAYSTHAPWADVIRKRECPHGCV